jgi:hypothetical protein
VWYRPPVADLKCVREHALRAPLADEAGGFPPALSDLGYRHGGGHQRFPSRGGRRQPPMASPTERACAAQVACAGTATAMVHSCPQLLQIQESVSGVLPVHRTASAVSQPGHNSSLVNIGTCLLVEGWGWPCRPPLPPVSAGCPARKLSRVCAQRRACAGPP